MNNGKFWYIVLVAFWVTCTSVFGQSQLPEIRFVSSEEQQFGFDNPMIVQWIKNYEILALDDNSTQSISYKSMLRGTQDRVNLFIDTSVDAVPFLKFSMNDSSVVLKYSRISSNMLQLELPASEEDYLLKVYYKTRVVTALRVLNFDELTYKVKVIPLTGSVQKDSLKQYLNRVYAQAGISLDLSIDSRYELNKEIDSVFANPSVNHDMYTPQMIEVRDDYFDQFGLDKETYYIFIVADFVSPEIQGYMVRNKGVGFVKLEAENLYREIAHQLGYGIGQFNDLWIDGGPVIGSTSNLMDENGEHLTREQWQLVRENGGMVSYYDDFEGVRANNGIIAYYLWEENEDGTIKVRKDNLLGAVARPFKRNTYSLYLNIDNFFFYKLFDIGPYSICLLHILGFLLLGFSSHWVRKVTVRKVGFIQRRRILRFVTRVTSFGVHGVLFWLLFLLINNGYYMFEVDKGPIESLNGATMLRAKRELFNNQNLRRNTEGEIGSEVLVKRGKKWTLEKRKPVLYFDVKTKNGKRTMTYREDSDELHLTTVRFRKEVQTHYFVFRYKNDKGELENELVFNHLGLNITDKLGLEDPAERIVLFVNGYRPTSLGGTFEDNFKDIRMKGLEFKNSSNVIHSDDFYEYWRPWNEIDLKFAKRLNATATYYADGHHSVATSNHRSLIEFTRHSLEYPKRCKNPNRHVCKTQKKGLKWLGLQRQVPTYESQPLEANVEGFNERRENGRIAGRNLLQLLNEIPSKSNNDTLYIVAHSMGYAYALGIIDKVRGRINFGSCYIIAAENAESGEVNEDEWKEVWQYGSDFEAHKKSAPCLLDGIAPQSKAAGLSPRNRIYIPEKYYKRMGFFNSHFIGYYTWIFDIPKKESGHIEQR